MTAHNERQAPRSVGYACGLLRVQAACWVVVSALCMLELAESATVGSALGTAISALAGVIAVMFAILKWQLARRLLACPGQRRKVAIGVEFAMTCFGALGTLSPNLSGGIVFLGPIGLAFIVGGTGLSLAAVIGLLRPPARRYFAAPTCNPDSIVEPSNADGSDSAPFWRNQPTASKTIVPLARRLAG